MGVFSFGCPLLMLPLLKRQVIEIELSCVYCRWKRVMAKGKGGL
jgi:hypothetical protein